MQAGRRSDRPNDLREPKPPEQPAHGGACSGTCRGGGVVGWGRRVLSKLSVGLGFRVSGPEWFGRLDKFCFTAAFDPESE